MAEKYHQKINQLCLGSKEYVLVLPGWYPTWQEPFLGDFNQRHVQATSAYTGQVVLYIVKDQSTLLSQTETQFKQVNENLVEITVIYPGKRNKWADIFHSNFQFIRYLFTYAKMIKKRWGKPLLIHSYIVVRGGIGGWLLGKKWKLPFILSENWTIYYPSDPGFFLKRNLLFKIFVRRVYKNVKTFLPVTNNLKRKVNTIFGDVPSVIVPNVVDTNLFHFKKPYVANETFRFIHVSTMNYQKNPEGLLRSFKKFTLNHPSVELWMVGPYPEDLLQYAKNIGLREPVIHFTGPVSYTKVSEYLQASNALVLFSRYENLPCVILEALCCGLPVVSTDVGGIAEVIDSSNGVLVANEDEEELFQAFSLVFDQYHQFNRKSISATASKLYNYSEIGKQINSVYSALKWSDKTKSRNE